MWLKTLKKKHGYDKIIFKIYSKILRIKKWFESNFHEQFITSIIIFIIYNNSKNTEIQKKYNNI
jgi:hypothetical protein